MDIEKLIDHIIEVEGGYVYHENIVSNIDSYLLNAFSDTYVFDPHKLKLFLDECYKKLIQKLDDIRTINIKKVWEEDGYRRCEVSDCYRPYYAKGCCNAHYIRMRTKKENSIPIFHRSEVCTYCKKPSDGKGGLGLCGTHYKQVKSYFMKQAILSYMGGVCIGCKQKHSYKVMDFHHKDDSKEMSVSYAINSRSIEGMVEEVAKCVPVCANCHRLYHQQNTGTLIYKELFRNE